ncbi:MAG: hypothetical protein AAB214_06530 [Fibrobacterota bacterium]
MRRRNGSTKFGVVLVLAMSVFSLSGKAGASRPYLSWSQKGEVLWTGTVSDTAGNRYNIRILPGYKTAFGFGTESWGDGVGNQLGGLYRIWEGAKGVPKSARRLKEYGTARPWHGIADGVRQGKDVIVFATTDMMTEGAMRDWKEYLGDAARAKERESFGWWLYYPWVVVKGSVNTAMRQAIGVVMVGAGVTWAIAIRPGYQLTKPVFLMAWDLGLAGGKTAWGGLKIGWGFAVNQLLLGTATPIAGWAWNTALGIPMAVAGKVPSPKSVDGWWVSQIEGARWSGELDGQIRNFSWDGLDPITDTSSTSAWIRREVVDARRAMLRDSIADLHADEMERLRRDIDSLRQMRDSLQANVWEMQRRAVDSIVSESLGSNDWYRCKGKPGAQLPDSLELELRNRIRAVPQGAALSDSLVDVVVGKFRYSWGRCLSMPGNPPDPEAKYNPNHLLEDEMRQILK